MKNQSKLKLRSSIGCILAVYVLFSACTKNDAISSNQFKKGAATKKDSFTARNSDTTDTTYNLLLDANYETGTLTSGISNMEYTNDSASDAAYMISPGATGNYGIAHKVVLGDSSYFSNDHWRSESAVAENPEGQYKPGDERRYEFSTLLKDWIPYTVAQPADGDIIFQAKLGGGGNPAWYFMTKRNAIAFRDPNANLQVNIVNDYRPYINQWMNFRIDVLWSRTATGYIKVYSELPGQTTYTLIWQISNFQTWNPDNPAAVNGYMKWGLYLPDATVGSGDVTTRIIYHDDVRIYQIQP